MKNLHCLQLELTRAGFLTSTVNERFLKPPGFLDSCCFQRAPSSIQKLALDEGIFTGKLCCSSSRLPESIAENIHSHSLAGAVVTFYLNTAVLTDGNSVNENICIHCHYFQLERKMLLWALLMK